MKTIAIVSDIHSNLDALDAVARDIASQNVDEIWCLGDVIGYCHKTRECLEWAVHNCGINLQGNHEKGVLDVVRYPKVDLSLLGKGGEGAAEGLYWAVRQIFGVDKPLGKLIEAKDYTISLLERVLSPKQAELLEQEFREGLGLDLPKPGNFESRKDYGIRLANILLYSPEAEKIRTKLSGKPKHIAEGKTMLDTIAAWKPSMTVESPGFKVLLVHDNPIDPGNRFYVLDPRNPHYDETLKKYSPDQIFERWDDRWPDTNMIFYGHSHFSGVYNPEDRKERVLVGVGSVGIPRDGSKQATYAILRTDGKKWKVNIQRVGGIDWEATGRKMESLGLKNKFVAQERLD